MSSLRGTTSGCTEVTCTACCWSRPTSPTTTALKPSQGQGTTSTATELAGDSPPITSGPGILLSQRPTSHVQDPPPWSGFPARSGHYRRLPWPQVTLLLETNKCCGLDLALDQHLPNHQLSPSWSNASLASAMHVLSVPLPSYHADLWVLRCPKSVQGLPMTMM